MVHHIVMWKFNPELEENKKLEEKYEDCDVQFYKGDQPLYYFIMAVE